MPWKRVEGLALLWREESSTVSHGVFQREERCCEAGLPVAPCELQPGPVFVYGADLVVDETGGEGMVAHVVLIEVDVVFSGAFGVDDPYRGLLWQAEGEEVEGSGEVVERADEAR